MKLKQIGMDNGDRHLNGNIPNLKLGEYRYYPNDNPNVTPLKNSNGSTMKLSRKEFETILKEQFPDYDISPLERIISDNDITYKIGSIGKFISNENTETYFYPIVINKGYVCFREATKDKDGLLYLVHNGEVKVYKEKCKVIEVSDKNKWNTRNYVGFLK